MEHDCFVILLLCILVVAVWSCLSSLAIVFVVKVLYLFVIHLSIPFSTFRLFRLLPSPPIYLISSQLLNPGQQGGCYGSCPRFFVPEDVCDTAVATTFVLSFSPSSSTVCFPCQLFTNWGGGHFRDYTTQIGLLHPHLSAVVSVLLYFLLSLRFFSAQG